MQTLPVKGMAHITGGGLTGNIPRALPDFCAASLHRSAWTWGPLFDWLQSAANIDGAEMYRTFNCGIGMVVVVAKQHADTALAHLQAAGETVWTIGEIIERTPGGEQVTIG
jgi:phosphoribosylformylglycinamidine cyclo-ligase